MMKMRKFLSRVKRWAEENGIEVKVISTTKKKLQLDMNSSDVTKTRFLSPDKRWPIGDLVSYGWRDVYVSVSNPEKVIAGKLISVPQEGRKTRIVFIIGRR